MGANNIKKAAWTITKFWDNQELGPIRYLCHEATFSRLGEVVVLFNVLKQRLEVNEETKEYIPNKRKDSRNRP